MSSAAAHRKLLKSPRATPSGGREENKREPALQVLWSIRTTGTVPRSSDVTEQHTFHVGRCMSQQSHKVTRLIVTIRICGLDPHP